MPGREPRRVPWAQGQTGCVASVSRSRTRATTRGRSSRARGAATGVSAPSRTTRPRASSERWSASEVARPIEQAARGQPVDESAGDMLLQRRAAIGLAAEQGQDATDQGLDDREIVVPARQVEQGHRPTGQGGFGQHLAVAGGDDEPVGTAEHRGARVLGAVQQLDRAGDRGTQCIQQPVRDRRVGGDDEPAARRGQPPRSRPCPMPRAACSSRR